MSAQRIAIVTGAARGQGAAIVRRLRTDGFLVAAADVLVEELRAGVDALGDPGVMAVTLDVTSAQQWSAAVADVVEKFSGVTALVNNAGVLHRATLSDETQAGFERSWRVNCLGPFLGIQAVLERLRGSAGAAICASSGRPRLTGPGFCPSRMLMKFSVCSIWRWISGIVLVAL